MRFGIFSNDKSEKYSSHVEPSYEKEIMKEWKEHYNDENEYHVHVGLIDNDGVSEWNEMYTLYEATKKK